jgi:hypothetical protein
MIHNELDDEIRQNRRLSDLESIASEMIIQLTPTAACWLDVRV